MTIHDKLEMLILMCPIEAMNYHILMEIKQAYPERFDDVDPLLYVAAASDNEVIRDVYNQITPTPKIPGFKQYISEHYINHE